MNPVMSSRPVLTAEERERRIEELLDRIWGPHGDEDFEALEELTELLPSEDGKPMESPWHRAAVNLLIAVLTYCWRDRNDFYVGGNMFVYYFKRPHRRPLSRGPDFFYVAGVDRHTPRDKWACWYEGKFPNVIIELLSPSTAQVDRSTKKDDYEHLEINEYFIYDPAGPTIEGWLLNGGGKYEAIPVNDRGWLWSQRLQMWLGSWSGTYQETEAVWPRFYDAQGNLILTRDEAEELRANEEKKRADEEKKRADALEQELMRLREKLAELERGQKNG